MSDTHLTLRGTPEDHDDDTNSNDNLELERALDEHGVQDVPQDDAQPGAAADDQQPGQEASTPEAPKVRKVGITSAPKRNLKAVDHRKALEEEEKQESATPDPEPATEEEEKKAEDDKAAADTAAKEAQEENPDQKGEHDPEIDGLQQPRNLNPQNKANWNALKETAKRYKQEAREYKQQFEQVKGQAGQLDEKTKQELEDLRTYRRLHEIEQDPQFRQEHDDKIKGVEDEIYGILKAGGMPPVLIEELRKEDALRKGYGELSADDYWAQIMETLANGSPSEKKMAAVLKNRLERVAVLDHDRKIAIEKNAQAKSEYVQRKLQQEEQAKQERIQTMEARTMELIRDYPWAQEQKVPANATPEQKAQIEADNKWLKEVGEPIYQAALFSEDPRTRVDAAAAAVMAYKQAAILDTMQAQLAAKDNEIKAVRAELSKIRGAGKTSNAGAAAPTGPVKRSAQDRIHMNDQEAIELGMQEAGL